MFFVLQLAILFFIHTSCFAQYIEDTGSLEPEVQKPLAKNMTQSFPIFFQSTGDCHQPFVTVLYQSSIDYALACEALHFVRQEVSSEFGYQTEVPVSIEFKNNVFFSLYDQQGVEVSKEAVYGLYDRKRNLIEMSAYSSDIVQNLDREHFSLKIQKLPISSEEKNHLLLEFHRSIIIHELTHLFTQHNFKDDNPSPAIHEYFSYVVQLKSLPQTWREEILKLNPDVFTNDMQINSMIHFSNPHKFGVMSFRHFESLGDHKGTFIKDALNGTFRPDDLLEAL